MQRIAIDFSATPTPDILATFPGQGAVFSGRAVDHLLRCSTACADAASDMEAGETAAEPERLRLMLACAEACRAAAHVMILGVPHHRELCEACTGLCEACAASCDDDDAMATCAAICRDCAEACRRMLVH